MTSTKKSIGISFAGQYIELIINFLSVLVLARILSPEDIGIYSIAAFLMAALHAFRDFGVVQYVIQEAELTNDKIRSAMGVSIILALAVAAILLASSGIVADFYGKPEIQKILIVMAGSFAISPLGSLLNGLFRRGMQFKKIFIARIFSTLCHVTTAIVLALHGLGALSLAWANFAGILSIGIALNLMRPAGLPLLPQLKNIKAILSFGSIASVGNAATTAGTNVTDLIVGKIMNMAAVGYFARANGLVQLFTRLLTEGLLPLILPYFAQIRRQGNELSAHYLSAVAYLTAITWPFFATLMLLAAPIVRVLYGPQWGPSVPVVELLCIAGAISSISLFAGQVMVANGQVRSATFSQLLSLPVRIGAVLFASNYGLVYVAIALIISELLTLVIISQYLHKTIEVGLIAVMRACGKSALVALCSATTPMLVRLFWEIDLSHPWAPLSIGVIGAAAGWLASMFLMQHPLTPHIVSIFHAIRWFKPGSVN